MRYYVSVAVVLHRVQNDLFQSDGGSPLVCQSPDKKWYLKGMLSVGIGPCVIESTSPYFYTDVGMFVNWINIITGARDFRLTSFNAIPPRTSLISSNFFKTSQNQQHPSIFARSDNYPVQQTWNWNGFGTLGLNF